VVSFYQMNQAIQTTQITSSSECVSYRTNMFIFFFCLLTNKKEMYQCSMCTAGSSFCSLDINKLCVTCGIQVPHMCARCIRRACGIMPATCHRCTRRDHVCLSKCAGGCIRRKKPTCHCSTKDPVRLQVQKQCENKGRFFWTCRECDFFKWDE